MDPIKEAKIAAKLNIILAKLDNIVQSFDTKAMLQLVNNLRRAPTSAAVC